MRSCDSCPGGSECAGDNLVPVLTEIYSLYVAGETEKFAILFALSERSENLFERYNNQVSRICWTKAALQVIADVLVMGEYPQGRKELFSSYVGNVLGTAVSAFEKFPWYVSGLIGQAPDLYEAISYRDQEDTFASQLSKREFVKLCKDVVYGD